MTSQAVSLGTDAWMLRPQDVTRFMRKIAECRVTECGCWEWTGPRFSNHYGRFTIWVPRPRALLAHRVAYILAGYKLPAGRIVLHQCDNPPCCNPAHLAGGTYADNSRDQREKGRQLHGEKHPSAKLSQLDVDAIRHRRREGATLASIASEFGISFQHVSDIAHGRRWRDQKEVA